MEVRTLRSQEREDLLSLLDGWPMDDGWTGRDFFRRYVEKDPTFEDRNVWVAADSAGRLVSCVQIFPRRLYLWGEAVECGGIGSVFTLPERRREGLAERLLAAASAAMQERGMEIGVLFASRIAWYTRLGWRQFERQRILVDLPASGDARGDLAVRSVDLETDLTALQQMALSAELPQGRAARDPALWRASLALAGDPEEDFRVAECQGEIVAYARATRLEGSWQVTEWGRRPGRAASVAELLALLMEAERSSFTLGFCDEALRSALERLGAIVRVEVDADMMVRCLNVTRLAARLGVEPCSTDEMSDLLVGRLRSEPFCFWTADRF
jgi:predicted N-acetyltransferase YhbS